ncbi:MAG: HAMP domain-containing histidine kinase [Methanimicrococcus sp.]|nr:HAMP domain-containing histidine kinase [Methanimicrococcus sp.]
MTSDSPEHRKLPPFCRIRKNDGRTPCESVSGHEPFWSEEYAGYYESSFLHDLLNSAGGLHGYLELLSEIEDPGIMKKYAANLNVLCESLIDEIEYHRQFVLAESGRLNLVLTETTTDEILQLTALKLNNHAVSKGRSIEVLTDNSEKIVTDKVLLSRILVNMTKNAVEATEEGGTVMIGSFKFNDAIRFVVHNSAVILQDVQNKLFKSQFSTKGNGRGVGILSIRLLGELLGGVVGFDSCEEEGTCFYIDLPLSP